MKKYLVEVENEFGVTVYSEYAYGKNENQALVNLLKDETVLITEGDTISIEED